MDVFSTFEICDTLVYKYKFKFSIYFVPMLCSIVLVVKCYAFSLSTSLLCPLLDFISLMQLLWFLYRLSVGHANDTLH